MKIHQHYAKFQTKHITCMNPPLQLQRSGSVIELLDLTTAPLCQDVLNEFITRSATGAPLYLYHGLTPNGRDTCGVLYDFFVRDDKFYATFRPEGPHRLNVLTLSEEVGIPVVMMGEFSYDTASYRRCTQLTGFRINGEVGFKAH